MRTATTGMAALAALLLGPTGEGLAQTGPEPFHGDVEKLAKQNSDFRHVLFTAAHVQIVAMSLPANEDIGAEIHQVDQCLFFVEGKGETIVAGKVSTVKEDDVLCVPAGMRHDVRNTGSKPLKLYTLYSPPQHPPGTVHHTKQDAERSENKTEGKSPH
jgi:mannose-6-phosphate isomerase-like protein (cupin superfamily)